MKKTLSRREAIRLFALTAASSLVACQTNTRSIPTVSQPAASPLVKSTQASASSAGSTAAQVTKPAELTPTQAEKQMAEQATATPPPAAPPSGETYLSVARGPDPAAITEAALRALGGIERFVKNGYDVIIKPNICTDTHTFEYGTTTNPIVVATLVRLALGAGAKRVRVMDFPFGGTAASAYARSGIEEAVKTAGGEMEVMNANKFRMTAIPNGQSIKEWMIYQDVLACDLLIDVPTAKQSSPSTLSCGGKNLMGVIQNRGSFHAALAERIADLMGVVRPGLTVVDAVRTIVKNGPTGGSLDDVKLNNTVIASHDIVAADSYAARLIGLTGADIPYVAAAAKRGLGTIDLNNLKIEELSL